jgi:hypothetical protein
MISRRAAKNFCFIPGRGNRGSVNASSQVANDNHGGHGANGRAASWRLREEARSNTPKPIPTDYSPRTSNPAPRRNPNREQAESLRLEEPGEIG